MTRITSPMSAQVMAEKERKEQLRVKLLTEIREKDERIAELEAELAELREPSWKTYITITEQWLTHYPPDIFDGSSGDPGPLFVVAIRKAVNTLLKKDDEPRPFVETLVDP